MSIGKYFDSRVEFLTDRAAYFADKKNLYLQAKDDVSDLLQVPLSMIRVCGSAYWGQSFETGKDFTPGESDLDVAVISESLYVLCLSEARSRTRNFTNLTSFPKGQTIPITFQDYAYKKGIIRTDLMPSTRIRSRLEQASNSISQKHAQHFSKITFAIYDSESSFAVKQISSVAKFRG